MLKWASVVDRILCDLSDDDKLEVLDYMMMMHQMTTFLMYLKADSMDTKRPWSTERFKMKFKVVHDLACRHAQGRKYNVPSEEEITKSIDKFVQLPPVAPPRSGLKL